MIDFNKIPTQGWKLNQIMPWGKYKGATIQEIGEIDAEYLIWVRDNTETLFHPEVMEMLNKEINSQYSLSKSLHDFLCSHEEDLPF